MAIAGMATIGARITSANIQCQMLNHPMPCHLAAREYSTEVTLASISPPWQPVGDLPSDDALRFGAGF
jgi:hypothetical protein